MKLNNILLKFLINCKTLKIKKKFKIKNQLMPMLTHYLINESY